MLQRLPSDLVSGVVAPYLSVRDMAQLRCTSASLKVVWTASHVRAHARDRLQIQCRLRRPVLRRCVVSGCVARCVAHLVWTTTRSDEHLVTHDVPYCDAHMDADVLRRMGVYCVTSGCNTHVF